MERVKELSGASVPFSFDVHAMIASSNAPKLEKELHRHFRDNQVNKVNSRKEFFKLPLSAIKGAIDSMEDVDAHFTLRAEASEYRESLAIARNRVSSHDKVGLIAESA